MHNALLRRIGLQVVAAILILVSGASGSPAQGQQVDFLDRCERSSGNQARACEVTESTIAARSDLTVSAEPNGGVTVIGWDQNRIQVRALIQAQAPTEAEAVRILSAVTVETANGLIRAIGPETEGRRSWSVSYEISAPRRMDLDLATVNGGLSVTGIEGTLNLNTTNGGINLEDVGGSVRALTTNGGVRVRLVNRGIASGETVLRTTNGGISVDIPENYSAHLVASTVHGQVTTDFPITVQGRLGRRLEGDIGAGGPTVELSTTNGSIAIRRR